jgi:integrase
VATIRKRGNSWVLQWCENGQQHKRSLGKITRIEADRLRKLKADELLRARYSGVVSLPQASSLVPTLAEFARETYLPWRGAEYPSTQDGEERRWIAQLVPNFGHLQLDRIGLTAVENWKGRRLGQVKAATVTKELRSLMAALNRAVTLRLISANPLRGIRAPKDLESRPPRWYTAEELERLYRHSQHLPGDEQSKGLPPNGFPNWAPVWRLMANTGMRRAEALQLKWADVGDALRVLSSEEARTKSGKWRHIPLSEGAQEALDALKAMTGSKPHVLPQVHPDALTARFSRHLERSGLDGSLHCLRHTFCAQLVSAGIPLRTVQILAGHASITTTERYAHLSPEHVTNAVRVLRL